jgi:hypothetical protein
MNYFILGTPGSGSAFVGDLLYRYISSDPTTTVEYNSHHFDTARPELCYSDWFYDNIKFTPNVINITTTQTVSVTPEDIDLIRSKFPSSKIIVITYQIEDIPIIAKCFYYSFFSNGKSVPWAGPQQVSLLKDYPELFSIPNMHPKDFTRSQREAFIYIIGHRKFLDRLWNVILPDDAIEIKFRDILLKPDTVKETLSILSGGNPDIEELDNIYSQFLEEFIAADKLVS